MKLSWFRSALMVALSVKRQRGYEVVKMKMVSQSPNYEVGLDPL